jgi:hypothetical protein
MLEVVSVSGVVNFRLEHVIIPSLSRFSSRLCCVYVDYYFCVGCVVWGGVGFSWSWGLVRMM